MAKIKLTNGVSFGSIYTVTAADEAAEEITFDFVSAGDAEVTYPLAAVIQVRTDAGVNVDLADAVITYPADGQVKIANGAATFALAEDQEITIIANRVKGY